MLIYYFFIEGWCVVSVLGSIVICSYFNNSEVDYLEWFYWFRVLELGNCFNDNINWIFDKYEGIY